MLLCRQIFGEVAQCGIIFRLLFWGKSNYHSVHFDVWKYLSLHNLCVHLLSMPVTVAARFKAWVCSCWDCGFESHRGMIVCFECRVLSGRGLCDELITLPPESYRLWCVVVCNLETSWMRSSWPFGGCRSKNEQFVFNTISRKRARFFVCFPPCPRMNFRM